MIPKSLNYNDPPPVRSAIARPRRRIRIRISISESRATGHRRRTRHARREFGGLGTREGRDGRESGPSDDGPEAGGGRVDRGRAVP